MEWHDIRMPVIECRCGEQIEAVEDKKPVGLGDWTEQGLKRIGITPERYVEAKRLFGLRPTCGCEGRKEWLNRVGEWWTGLAEQQRQHEHDQKDSHADRGES